LQPPEAAPVKSVNFADSQAADSAPAPVERGVRGRFVLPARAEPEYRLNDVAILSSVGEAGPLDRAGAFRQLAMREQILRLARARLQGGTRKSALLDYRRDPCAIPI
jgi:hypothetical protein